MTRAVVLLAILGLAAPSAARPLRAEDVIDSTLRTHPGLDEARASVSEARGKRLSALRAFEPRAKAAASALPEGYYQYAQLTAAIEQVLPTWGIGLEGGYRLGRGEIPPYYGERETLDGGELFARVSVPLLEGRSIDANRAGLRLIGIEVQSTQVDLDRRALSILRDAWIAYWSWVGAGQKLRLSRELLAIARVRAETIATQAETGARPRIEAVDARRVVLDRESSVLSASAAFVEAQAELALYYRDSNAEPVYASEDQLPTVPIDLGPEVDDAELPALIEDAYRRRPELRALQLERRSSRIDRELADNRGLPRLDLNAFVARDVGDGPDRLGQTDLGVGVSISMPLFRRQARGDAARADARLARADAKIRALRDRIAAELRASLAATRLAQQRASLARERLDATERLADAERTRLQQGASDILVVNLRELDVAQTARETIDAAVDAHRAWANLRFLQGLPPSSDGL